MRALLITFVKRPIIGNSLIAFLVFAFIGWLAGFWGVNTSFFPERTSKRISISVAYYGASPQEMEEGVTTRIEESLKGISGIDEIKSVSSENVASIIVTGVYNADFDELMTDVKNAVDRISSFPENAERPVIFKQKPSETVAFMNLAGDMDLIDLKKQAELIEDMFLAKGVVSQMEVTGYPELELAIELDEKMLTRYNLTFDEISNAIRFNNMDMSGGAIKAKDEEIFIRSRNRSLKPVDLENIIIRSLEDGSQLRLKEVASVTKKFSETPFRSYFKEKPSISVVIKKLPEEDLQSISEYIQDYAKQYNAEHEDKKLTILFDFNTLLDQRIETLASNGFQGLILVLILLGLFLNVRLSIWVAWGIPASFIGMFIIGSFVGITINMISLFGMILVVGILVDDGIVIAENIYKHYESGANRFEAVIDGTMEVFPAVFTSVTTTMICFVPLLLSEGSDFIGEMSVVVIASLGFSLIEAFVVLPMHLASKKILNPETKHQRSWSQNLFLIVRRRFYDTILNSILRSRMAIYLSVFIGFFVVPAITFTMIGTGQIKTTFFPSIPFDEFSIDVAFKPGEREDKTEDYLRKFNSSVLEVNQEVIEETGDTILKYTSINVGTTQQIGQTGGHAGHVYISVDSEDKSIDVYEFIERIRKRIGEVPEAEQLIIGKYSRWGKPVSLGLLGKDIEELQGAKKEVMTILKNMSSVRDISDNTSTGKREILLELKPEAYALGFRTSEIIRQIRQGFFGDEIQRIQEGTDEVKVWVRYNEANRQSILQLENMKIRGPRGEQIPLTSLADYRIERGIEKINHYNGSREIRIEAEKRNYYESTTELLDSVSKKVDPILASNYPGVKLTYGGERRRGTRAIQSLQKYGIPAVVIMFVLIMIHFGSFSQGIIFLPLIIIGFCCASFGHWIRDIPLSVLSAYGIMALLGVIVNDAVVMIDKYNSSIKEGRDMFESAFIAGISRFRPIVLTSITTVAGLLPLIIQNDFQSRFLIPMAVGVASGVFFGTFFILLFLPPLMIVMNDFRWYRSLMSSRFFNNNIPDKRELLEPAMRAERRMRIMKKELSKNE